MAKSQYRRYGNLVYGIDTFRGLFNDRQLYVLGSLCEAVRDAYDEMLAERIDITRATAIATYLGLLIDRIADYNSFSASLTSPLRQSRTLSPNKQ